MDDQQKVLVERERERERERDGCADEDGAIPPSKRQSRSDIESGHQERIGQGGSRTYSELRFQEYWEDNRSPTLRYKGGTYGYGSEVLINDLFDREPSK